MNVWLKNQIFLTLRYNRFHLFGYRDVLQDAWGHLFVNPADSKKYILEALSYMYEDGRCPRQYDIFSGILDKADFMDSPTWIPYAVCGYIKETGDWDLINTEVGYFNSEKKNTVLTDMEKRLVAYHEVGHALVAALEKNTQPVSKITIVPHTSGALGYTMQMPEEEKYLHTSQELLTELRTLVGGRAAEQVVFGVQTTGAANDIQRAIGRVAVVADCAHALGAEKDGKKAGQIADFTSFSFHAVKNLTTAEGGAATWKSIPGIDNDKLYQQYMLYSLHGQSKDAFSKTQAGAWEYDVIGPWYKCNMTDITAAIGLKQLERYPEMLKRRKEIIKKFDEALKYYQEARLCFLL